MLEWDKIGRLGLKAGAVMGMKPAPDKGLVRRRSLFKETGRCQVPTGAGMRPSWKGESFHRDLCAGKKEPGWSPVLDHLPCPQCPWAHARETGRHLRVSSTPRIFRMSMGQTGTAAGYWAKWALC